MGIINLSNEVAPATPAAGNALQYVDSTSLNFCSKNSAGQINHGIQTIAPLSGQYITAINDDGTNAVTSFGPGLIDLIFSGTIDTVASASALNLSSTSSYLVDVSGTTTITSIPMSANANIRVVRFTGALTLTNNAAIILPGGASITTVAGDFAIFVRYTSSITRCVSYFTIGMQGSGQMVRATSPTLTTPVIGAATGTSLAVTGALTSSSATSGLGAATGAGGTVTQATSKATGVTLNKICGQITLVNTLMLTLGITGFTLTNSSIAATDCVIVWIVSGATNNSYNLQVDAVAAGSCHINMQNISAGSLSEAFIIGFMVIKAVTA